MPKEHNLSCRPRKFASTLKENRDGSSTSQRSENGHRKILLETGNRMKTVEKEFQSGKSKIRRRGVRQKELTDQVKSLKEESAAFSTASKKTHKEAAKLHEGYRAKCNRLQSRLQLTRHCIWWASFIIITARSETACSSHEERYGEI